MLSYEGRYERLFGIKTMQIKKSDDANNFHYQGASYMILLDLFKQLPKALHDSNFIDIGCGKGRPLFCAEYSGFNKLIGVELDQELVMIADQNISRYLRKRKESQFKFICENALTFQIPSGTSVFFFFNPFSDKIMTEVEKNISAYQKQSQAEIFIVYVNPQFKNVWIDAGYDIYHTEGNKRYTEALIFHRKNN